MQAKEPSDRAENTLATPSHTAFGGPDDRAQRSRPDAHGPSAGPRSHGPRIAREKPLLMVDIDGVLSLFGFAGDHPGQGHSRGGAPWTGQVAHAEICYATIDGIPHLLSRAAAGHLQNLAAEFDLVWASGWEEKAEEYLPRLLGLPAGLPFLRFERSPGRADPHWKLSAIESYAGTRALAWIDDAFNDACHAWADARTAPTRLVQTAPAHGLTSAEAQLLTDWSQSLMPPRAGAAGSPVPRATPRR